MTKITYVANWKMHGRHSEVATFVEALDARSLQGDHVIVVCPPFTLIGEFCRLASEHCVEIGGQDCHFESGGAHTGEVAAAMLEDLGATHVILGHSERRAGHGEDNHLVMRKVEAACAAGLTAILCVGESELEQEQDRTLDVISRQLRECIPGDVDSSRLVVAYEPIWAIGTGKVPSVAGIARVHDQIKSLMCDRFGKDAGHAISVLYGGSVIPSNAAEIMEIGTVDGCLVGGASLDGNSFRSIVRSCMLGK